MRSRHWIMLGCFAAALPCYLIGSSVRGAGVFLLAGFAAEMFGWFQVGRSDERE